MKNVVILGGGVAGMSAAHELIERGYTVSVYEKQAQYCGGKARSINYFGRGNTPYPQSLPGEHGFRFFPGFYKHVIDTMKRIPFHEPGLTAKTVFDNLVPTDRIMIARYGNTPMVTPAHFPRSKADWELIFTDMHGMHSGLTKEEIKCFSQKVWQLCTSSKTRRENDYEGLGWWQFLEADRFPGTEGKPSPYQSLLVQGLTRTLVAARAESASTKTGGDIFLQLIYGMANPMENTDRVLNGPTNDRWLNAWRDYLISKGVRFIQHAEATAIHYADQRIVSAEVKIGHQAPINVQGDYFILAVPVEQAAKLMNPELIKADNTLSNIITLSKSVSWMNGIQFYLSEDVQINRGHVIYSDTEWAITSISQMQFWENYAIQTKGDGRVKGVLSVDISDWFSKGRFNGKLADECTAQEVADEVWQQIKASLNVNGETVLHDDLLIDWYLDRDIVHNASINDNHTNLSTNREPLLVNSINSWALRPEAYCAIPNLFFASDYVRTFTDLATMEGANEAARRAVNALLDRNKDNHTPCTLWPLKEPPMFKPLKWYDKKRWEKGLPWTDQYPLWLKVGFGVWTLACATYDFFRLLGHSNPKK
ncbi:MAG: hydroxysqualene dehydroxylase [Chitinophagaceae bacterium]